MSMKKKALMGASYVLVAALAIGGTVAFLTDEEHDVNVMTLGNVDIVQHEYEREVGEDGVFKTDTIDNQPSYVLTDFTQLKPLLPTTDPDNHGAGPWDTTTVRMSQVDSYGGMQVFSNKNAQDKFVTVENAGRTDAYVRTLVAIEVGTGDPELFGIGFHQTWACNEVGTINVDGNNYYLFEFVYAGAELSDGSWRHENGVLPAGDTSYPNLSQVYLNAAATNEDVEAIDGNNDGLLDILVVSQAVQAEGFDNAETALNAGFGDITTENHPWSAIKVSDPVVYTSGEHTISGDITLTDDDEATDCVTADGEGVVVNILDGTYFDNNENAEDKSCVVWAMNGATVNIYGGTFKANAIEAGSHSDMIYAGANGGIVNIYGGTFEAVTADDWLLNEKDEQGTMTVYGGTFKNFDPSKVTSEKNKTSFVADGYKVVETKDGDDTWYTVVEAK